MAKQRRTNNAKFNGNSNSRSQQAKSKHNQSAGSKNKGGVEIFTALGCPHCQDAKMYMQMNKIKFTEFNLDRQPSAEKRFLAMGGKKIPLIFVKGKILRSWNQQAFEKAYKS